MASCTTCGTKAYGEYCFRHKPRKPVTTKKPMNKRGKVTKTWIETRNRWLQVNKAAYYFCYICGKQMTKSQLTLDHIKSRSRHPELRFDWHNLAPCCYEDNIAKGSLSLEEYLSKKGSKSN